MISAPPPGPGELPRRWMLPRCRGLLSLRLATYAKVLAPTMIPITLSDDRKCPRKYLVKHGGAGRT
jgi:hypothetical protein